MQLQQPQGLQIFAGNDLTFTNPSGHVVTIREQNGDDDETLSLLNNDEMKEEVLKNLNIFLSKIVKDNTYNNTKSLPANDLMKLKLKDKYYILLKTRMHSVGKLLKFKSTCPKCKQETAYKQDLSVYDTDLSNFNPEADRYKYQITPHEAGKETTVEFTLSSGKRVRYTYLNVEGEIYLSKLSKISANSELYARNLSIWDGTDWVTPSAYNIFSKPDMIEIVAHIEANDTQFEMLMDMECGNPACKHQRRVPFLYLKDFFFPVEI